MNDAEALAVLQARARELARPVAGIAAEPGAACVVFSRADETWAIPMDAVVEVSRTQHIAVLPGAEPPLLGLTTWRGDVMPVIDIASLLGLPSRDGGRLVMIGRRRAAFALVVDNLLGIQHIDLEALRAPRSERGGEYVRGVSETSVVVLNHSALLELYS